MKVSKSPEYYETVERENNDLRTANEELRNSYVRSQMEKSFLSGMIFGGIAGLIVGLILGWINK